MPETLRTIAFYFLFYLVSPLVQLFYAYLATGLVFPSVCGLIIKRYKTPNRVIRQFDKEVHTYQIIIPFWVLRKRMSYPRLLWGLTLRGAVYLAFMIRLFDVILLNTMRGAFDVALYGFLHFVAHLAMIIIMSKIIMRLWQMSKIAKTTPST